MKRGKNLPDYSMSAVICADNRDYGTAYGSCSCGDCTDAEDAGRGSVPLSCDRRKQQL